MPDKFPTQMMEIPSVAAAMDAMTDYQLVVLFQTLKEKTKEEILDALETAALQQG